VIWIFLSPHFDDVALSCGGLVWELARQGNRVEIWTICSGLPPDLTLPPFARQLHERWRTGGPETVELRRLEDEEACRRLGVLPRTFGVPDCIYRRLPGSSEPLVQGEEDLYKPVHPAEESLVTALAQDLEGVLPPGAQLASPLGLGRHVDHRLTRTAAEMAAAHAKAASLVYYADYPYVVRPAAGLDLAADPHLEIVAYPISTPALQAWQAAIEAYASQLSTFWSGPEEMRAAIAEYANGGVRLYREDRRE